MIKQGWLITGQDSDLEISETRASDSEYNYGELTTYEALKAEAIKQLQDHIQPYLQRIEELQTDTFAVSKKLPPLKAWRQQQYQRGNRTSDERHRVYFQRERRLLEWCGIRLGL